MYGCPRPADKPVEVGTNCVYFCESGWIVNSGNELMGSLNHLLKFAKLEKVFTLKTTPLSTYFFLNTYQIHRIKLVWAVAHVRVTQKY